MAALDLEFAAAMFRRGRVRGWTAAMVALRSVKTTAYVFSGLFGGACGPQERRATRTEEGGKQSRLSQFFDKTK